MEATKESRRCKECGLKKRGPNHDKGDDHIRRKAAREAKATKAA